MANAKKILCIEDDPEIIDLIRLILARKGYTLLHADGGIQGMDVLRRELPDLVLLDLMMPDMDGWEVYQRMRSDPSLEHIPVIVVTARGQNIDKILGLHIAKVDDYVVKPFSPDQLLHSIERVLALDAPPEV